MQATLEKLNNFITLQNEDRSNYTKSYDQLLKTFLTEMEKVDPLFKALRCGHILAGSYLDNLKISKPDEFDVNVQLKLPMNHSEIDIINSTQRDGYVIINIAKGLNVLSRHTDKVQTYIELKKLTDDEGFLLQNKVHSWLESVVRKALENYKKTYPSLKINHTKNGPAHTLDVDNKFSVDLVGAFVFYSNHFWVSDRSRPELRSPWLAIPRPYKANSDPNNRNWIPAYAMLEKDMIHNKYAFKNSIRLLKKLRDNSNLCNLKSYFIKTVFMWELEKNPTNYWSQPSKLIFLSSLDALIACLEKHELNFFWDRRYNMLTASLSKHQIDDLCIKLKKIRAVILQNVETPENFIYLFLNNQEQEKYKKGVPRNDDIVNGMTQLMIGGSNNSKPNPEPNNQAIPDVASTSTVQRKDTSTCVIS